MHAEIDGLLRRAGRVETFLCREMAKIVREELEEIRGRPMPRREVRSRLERAREAAVCLRKCAARIQEKIEEIEILNDVR